MRARALTPSCESLDPRIAPSSFTFSDGGYDGSEDTSAQVAQDDWRQYMSPGIAQPGAPIPGSPGQVFGGVGPYTGDAPIYY